MTRSHNFNSRDHSAEAAGEVEHVPKYFAKHGFVDAAPDKVKKNGGGKGNWGHPGDEVEDLNIDMSKPRRRSNSSSHIKSAQAFKTKFETIEAEPVFEMSEHGPLDEDLAEYHASLDKDKDGQPLEHQSTASSVATSEGQSVEE